MVTSLNQNRRDLKIPSRVTLSGIGYYTESANLEHAARAAIAWAPEGYDGRRHYREVLMAVIPALTIIAAAALFLVH